MEALDAIIFVKVLERGYQMLANSSVPLLWDHLDEWDGFPFWDLASWDLKYAFAGVFTAGRVAKMAFDRAGIPAHFVYHNHNNEVRPQCQGPQHAFSMIALKVCIALHLAYLGSHYQLWHACIVCQPTQSC